MSVETTIMLAAIVLAMSLFCVLLAVVLGAPHDH